MNTPEVRASIENDPSTRLKQMLSEEIRAEISDTTISRHLEYLVTSFDADDLKLLRDALLSRTAKPESLDLRDVLVNIQRRRIRASTASGIPTVAFYFPTAAYRSNIGHLPARLRSAGNTVLTLIGEVCDDYYEKQPQVFFAGNIGGREISWQLDGIDMILFPHIEWNLPKDAKRVYFPHDMHDAVDWTVARRDGSVDDTLLQRLILSIDYIVLPLRYDVARVSELISASKSKHRIRKPVVLIPGGYPKLDRNIEYHAQHPQEVRSIIYALTLSDKNDHLTKGSGLFYAPQVVEAVLEAFPEYEFIFRPHPHTVTWPAIRSIVDRYAQHPRFVFDDAPSFYMDQYSRSALMITDLSGTAYTYAFSTLRPVVFYNPPTLPAPRVYQHLRFMQDRSRIGSIAESIPQLIAEIKAALGNGSVTAEAIRTYRDGIVYNLGNAEEYFVENYPCILSGEKHPDWIYL